MTKAPSITRAQQVQIDAAAAVFRPWGLSWEVEMGGKHMLIRVTIPNVGSWRMPIACTPKDIGDAANVTRQRANRLVRTINDRLGVFRAN